MKPHRLVVASMLAALAWAVACDLNPQPLPPAQDQRNTPPPEEGEFGAGGSETPTGASRGPDAGELDAGDDADAGGDAS